MKRNGSYSAAYGRAIQRMSIKCGDARRIVTDSFESCDPNWPFELLDPKSFSDQMTQDHHAYQIWLHQIPRFLAYRRERVTHRRRGTVVYSTAVKRVCRCNRSNMYSATVAGEIFYVLSHMTLTFELLTLKVVSESRVMWATSVPILVFIQASLFSTQARCTRQTDRQTSDSIIA